MALAGLSPTGIATACIAGIGVGALAYVHRQFRELSAMHVGLEARLEDLSSSYSAATALLQTMEEQGVQTAKGITTLKEQIQSALGYQERVIRTLGSIEGAVASLASRVEQSNAINYDEGILKFGKPSKDNVKTYEEVLMRDCVEET